MNREILNSTLNDIGKKFDYRKKEILFDRFKGWFDGITFARIDMTMGWGKYQSSDGSLIIGTACFDGGEWLDTVIHQTRANNPYNGFVNAIAYWDMMNEKGHEFWLNYYSGEIETAKAIMRGKIKDFENRIASLNKAISEINKEVASLSAKPIQS